MKKRDSLRRWKARCRLGRQIPMLAIMDYRLDRWFSFVPVSSNSEIYMAVM